MIYFSHSSIGVAFAITGNLLISIALNIQKHVVFTALFQHNTIVLKQSQVLLPGSEGNALEYLNYKSWWLGMCFLALGEIGNFIAYGFASAVLVLLCNLRSARWEQSL
jgi:magnesium transporter